jgi:hypothetical protein
MVEDPGVSFFMHGARAAIADGLAHIEEQVKGIELAVVENPGLAFDLAKTLVESVCRGVLDERSVSYADSDDLPKLFRTATNCLPFLPMAASSESEIRKSLATTLNGLHTTVQGICELRNQCGFASHGFGGPRPPMESVQALLAAQAADAIVGFLYRVHKQAQVASTIAPLKYEDNSAFNESIDDLHGPIRIFDEEFEPSRVLFVMAPEPYKVYLAEFAPEVNREGASTGPSSPPEGAP